MNAFLTIDFNEGDQSSYRGIDIVIDGNWDNKKSFNSGNITVDFINYLKWSADQNFSYVSFSSSWDHFFMDGELYKGLLIDHGNENKVITNIKDPRFDEAIEYPVPLEINNFEEMKTYYKTNNEL